MSLSQAEYVSPYRPFKEFLHGHQFLKPLNQDIQCSSWPADPSDSLRRHGRPQEETNVDVVSKLFQEKQLRYKEVNFLTLHLNPHLIQEPVPCHC